MNATVSTQVKNKNVWKNRHPTVLRILRILRILTSECALPGRKVRSETIPNQKSVLKLDDLKNFSCFFPVKA